MPIRELRVKTRRPGLPVVLLRLPPYLADETLPAPFSPRQREHLLRIAEILAETAAGELNGIPDPGRCAPPVLCLRAALSDAIEIKHGKTPLRLLTVEALLTSRRQLLAHSTVREYWTEDGRFCTGEAISAPKDSP